jgi:hypothetical protein
MFGFSQFFSKNTFVSHTTLALISSLFNVAHLFRGALKAAAVQITVEKSPSQQFTGQQFRFGLHVENVAEPDHDAAAEPQHGFEADEDNLE